MNEGNEHLQDLSLWRADADIQRALAWLDGHDSTSALERYQLDLTGATSLAEVASRYGRVVAELSALLSEHTRLAQVYTELHRFGFELAHPIGADGDIALCRPGKANKGMRGGDTHER